MDRYSGRITYVCITTTNWGCCKFYRCGTAMQSIDAQPPSQRLASESSCSNKGGSIDLEMQYNVEALHLIQQLDKNKIITRTKTLDWCLSEAWSPAGWYISRQSYGYHMHAGPWGVWCIPPHTRKLTTGYDFITCQNLQFWQVCSFDGLSVCLFVCLFVPRYRSQFLTNHRQTLSTYVVYFRKEPYSFSRSKVK